MKTKNITELAEVIRSKNSGPFEITLDIIFKDFETYNKVKRQKVIGKKLIADLYKISESEVLNFIEFDPAKAIKATIVRKVSSGAVGETDVYGAQQHVPLFQIEVPWE